MNQIYKMYNSNNADSSVSIDIREDGILQDVYLDLDVPDATAATEGVGAQLSFVGTASFATNDSTQIIAEARVQSNGVNVGTCTKFAAFRNLNIPVSAGERVFLHIDVVGTCTPVVVALLNIDQKGGGSRPNARRRSS